MDSQPVILDISSDDEDEREESNDSRIDWLAELFDEGEDTDDVVVVDEFSCFPAIHYPNHPPLTVKNGGSVDNLDDDCLILDGDPDKLANLADDKADNSDDLLIIAEKGPVACRDFPHSRNLCVKFPFSSTPHENHCDLCHCYVCDKHAPCSYWGIGVSPSDHCHATDKEERWKAERKRLKLGSLPLPAFQKFPNTTLSITSSIQNYEPILPLSQPPIGAVRLQQPHISKIHQIQSCPSNNFITPNVLSHSRHHQRQRFGPSRFSVPQPSIRPQLMPRAQLLPRAHNIQRKTSGSLRPLSVAHPTRFKKLGPLGASPVISNRSGYGSSGMNQIFTGNSGIPTFDGINQSSWQDFLVNNSEMCAVQNFSQPNANDFTDPPPTSPLPYYLPPALQSSTVSSQNPGNFQALPMIEESNQPLPQSNPNTNMPVFDNPVLWECNSDPVDLSWINAPTLSSLPQPAEEPHLPTVQHMETPFVAIQEATVSSLAFDLQNWPEHEPVLSPANDQVLSEVDSSPQSPEHPFGYNFESTWSGLADV